MNVYNVPQQILYFKNTVKIIQSHMGGAVELMFSIDSIQDAARIGSVAINITATTYLNTLFVLITT